MGYYTYFSLQVNPMPEEYHPLWEEEYYGGKLKNLTTGNIDTMKWYHHKEEMLEISKKYPEFVFILDGEGEDSADVWREFYRNGESYRWELQYNLPQFDETLLQ